MPFRYYSPGATIFALVVVGVLSLLSGSKKRQREQPTRPEPTPEEDANMVAMRKVVAEHEDCTAEVIKINVFGRRRVRTFRILSPGHKVELRMKKGDIKVFAYGEYVADLIPSPDSNLPRLLGGRFPLRLILEAGICALCMMKSMTPAQLSYSINLTECNRPR